MLRNLRTSVLGFGGFAHGPTKIHSIKVCSTQGQLLALLSRRALRQPHRLVARHQRSLDPDANRLNEATSEPTEEGVQKVFTSLWPRRRRLLVNPGSIYQFVLALASACKDSCFEVRDHGILVLKPKAASTNSPHLVDVGPEAESSAKGAGANVSLAESLPTKHPIAYCEDPFLDCL
jgi:hypothetical protein